ncbi:MAG: BatD family protein [Owenweeksia sp.]|nr:BatD family protein [Owenweeksia sp.]
MATSLQAQVSFTAQVNRDHVGKNERFTVQFSLNAKAEDFSPPSFENFRVLGGPNQSQSMRIVNYQRSVENTYSYVLMPRQPGVFSIGQATAVVDGEKYQTEPLRVKVSVQSPRANDPNDPYAIAARRAFLR